MLHIEPVRNDALVVSSVSILAKYNFVGRECLDACARKVLQSIRLLIEPSMLQRPLSLSFPSFWHRAMKEKFPS